jgi:hypothetical protein
MADQEGIQVIGPDLQTPAINYYGKFVLCPLGSFQRLSGGIAVIDAQTDQLVGILQNLLYSHSDYSPFSIDDPCSRGRW